MAGNTQTTTLRKCFKTHNQRMQSAKCPLRANFPADTGRYVPRGNFMFRIVRINVLILGALLSLGAKAECDHDRLSNAMKDYASEIPSTKAQGRGKLPRLESENLCLDYLEYIYVTSLSDSNQDFRLLGAIALIRLNSKKYSNEILNVIEADLEINSSSNGMGILFSTQTTGQKERNKNTFSWLRKLESKRAKGLIKKYGG